MSKIIGAFYFEQTYSGNLIGEFVNNKMSGISTESADTNNRNECKFVGNYKTTWSESEKSEFSYLKIEIKENTNNTVFKLTWNDKSGSSKFTGIGFITDEKLIGYYTDEK